jgi:hypothetical protein
VLLFGGKRPRARLRLQGEGWTGWTGWTGCRLWAGRAGRAGRAGSRPCNEGPIPSQHEGPRPSSGRRCTFLLSTRRRHLNSTAAGRFGDESDKERVAKEKRVQIKVRQGREESPVAEWWRAW